MKYRTLRRTVPSGIVIGALGMLLSACQAPDPHPFQEYAAAVKQAGDGLDQVMVQDIAWSKDEYIDKVLDGSVKLRQTAILDETRPFTVVFPATGATTNQPTFYKLQEVRVTLLNLNSATEKYVNLLVTLAGTDLVNPDTFAAMANETDAGLNAAAAQLNAQVPGAAINVFSVSSAEIARLIIENKRQKALAEILADNQTRIQAFSDKSLELLRILDESLLTDYSKKADAIESDFSSIPPDKRTQDPKARADVEQLLQLNADYMALVQSLQAAKSIYESLPKGHNDLLKLIQKKPSDLAAVKDLYQEAQHLKQIYDGLKKPASP